MRTQQDNGATGREVKVAVIGGDGIGPEVTEVALQVLEAVSQGSDWRFETTEFNLGAQRYLDSGEILPDAELAALKEHDAIILGAVGDPRVTSGVLERGLLLRLRFALDHYINLRPARHYPGMPSPLSGAPEIDFVVVREGTEGPYCGNGGSLRKGTAQEVATETSVNTAYGVERTVRYAFDLASRRARKKLTYIHKTNVLVHAGDLWRRTVEKVASEYPGIAVDYLHVDAATIFLVTDPARFDVIVTDNLFGDILTDQAGAITGGIGTAASGNINPEGAFPSMFEPVHGSAPDIAGTGVADPVAAVGSIVLLLRHLGADDLAQRVERAISEHMAWRAAALASESGWQANTKEISTDICSRL